jgi:geranylgeranyl diphosphate synthase type II
MIEYSERIAAIEQHLSQWEFPVEPKNLYDPLRYFISIGGKRIRPLFTILSAELYNIPIQESLPGASALELFHNFTLIHDDIMDKAPVRRGLTTVHEKWDTNIAILSGDVLMIHAFQALTSYHADTFKRLSIMLNQTAIEVCIGQQMDMDFEQIDTVTEADYIEMIRLKTSVLLGCACAFGGIIGSASESSIKSLYEFGENLGIAFQIQDDILDAFGDSAKVGKQVGGDILSDKKTIFAPAMNEKMWLNDITQKNISKILQNNFAMIEPEKDVLACGEEGLGKMASPEKIVVEIHYFFC